jgi:hypothetical protein
MDQLSALLRLRDMLKGFTEEVPVPPDDDFDIVKAP